VDFVIIAPNGIVGLVRDRRTASNLLDQTTVFVLLYVLNAMPLYFLAGQGHAAQTIGLVFWAILSLVGYMRGQFLGRPWLVVFPVFGAVFQLGLILDVFRLSPEAIYFIPTVILTIGLGCGLIPSTRISPSTEGA
jgi:hypothetical protein